MMRNWTKRTMILTFQSKPYKVDPEYNIKDMHTI